MSKSVEVSSVLQKIDEIIGNEISLSDNLSKIENEFIKINEYKTVSSYWVLKSNRKIIGKYITFSKKVLRKISKWYVNGIIDQQNSYNTISTKILLSYKSLFKELINRSDRNTKVINQLTEEITELKLLHKEVLENMLQEQNNNKIGELREELDFTKGCLDILNSRLVQIEGENVLKNDEINSLNQIISEMANNIAGNKNYDNLILNVDGRVKTLSDNIVFANDRIRRIERKIHNNLAFNCASEVSLKSEKEAKSNELEIDYFLFEHKFRGSREYIKNLQRRYLDVFKSVSYVLDIGCGRGEFLELLLENGISAKGIDISSDFVDLCLENNLPVEKIDMFAFLEKAPDNSIGGIFCSQVVEHLTPQDMILFIKLAHQKLESGAPLVIETINPKNLVAVSNWFYMDLSHVRPVHPETLSFILEQECFNVNEVIYTDPNTEQQIPSLEISGVEANQLNEFNYKIKLVNEILYGPQNFSILAKKIGF